MDAACRKNAFIMLCSVDSARALAYLNLVYAQIPTFDEFMQLAIIELIKKDGKINFAAKVREVSQRFGHHFW